MRGGNGTEVKNSHQKDKKGCVCIVLIHTYITWPGSGVGF